MEIKAVEWEARVPGYRGVIQWSEGWVDGDNGDEYPELFRPMVWDLARSECTDCSDQIYPPEGPGHGYATFMEAFVWLRDTLDVLYRCNPVAGPVNVDANGAPV